MGFEIGFVSIFFTSTFFTSAFFTSTVFSVSAAATGATCSSLGLFSTAFLRGRPTFFFGGATAFSVAGTTSAFTGSASLGCALAAGTGTAVSVLVISPFLVAENTLFSFFIATRERFFLSSLRSSFNLSAATFLVAPAIACSSRIL